MNAAIREYQPQHRDQVIHLLRLNVPEYFAPEEEAELIRYLDKEIEHYYVVELDRRIVGSGGINYAENGTIGVISWDIFHPDYQDRSLGTRLVKYRIEKLKADGQVRSIVVRTSQMTYKFYEKQGFTLMEIVKNYWADGFDMYFMKRSIGQSPEFRLP